LIESALNYPLRHQVAIHYITSILIRCEIIGDNLLVAYADKNEAIPAETFLIKMQPGLFISNYQQLVQSKIQASTYTEQNS
jgi:hypothetical protein